MNRIKWFDAIRVFGLSLILGYHLFYNSLPGGFLGVDVFFTFSGFLITAVILEEVRSKDGFALFKFYKRRFQRIFIPLILAVVFTLPFMLLISPDFTVGIAKQSAAALSFTSNWFYISAGSSYEAQLLPSVYIHTWYVAVEMQFYLLWGFVCFLLSWLSKVIFKNSSEKRYVFFKTVILIISGIAAVCSFLYVQASYNTGIDLNAVYFNTFSRFSFFIGAVAAIWGINDKRDEAIGQRLFSKHTKTITAALITIAMLAVAVIVFNCYQYKFTDEFIYRFGFLLASLLTVVLIYAAHGLHILTPPEIKEPRVLTAVADMSYDVYLFHWPFYVILSAFFINNITASLMTIVISFIFSALMTYSVQRVLIPLNNADVIKYKNIIAAVICIFTVGAAAAGGMVITNAPPITGIEQDFAAGHVTQDAGNILSLKQSIDAIGAMPVAYSAQNIPLRANLLPGKNIPASLTMNKKSGAPAVPIIITTPVNISGGVTIIGDSVALGAQATLINIIPDCHVDAEVSRQVYEGVGILTNLQKRGKLNEYVVIALGTNGIPNYIELMTQIIDALDPGYKLIFVTPFDGRSNENARILTGAAAWMRDLPKQYDYITVADWNDLIGSQVNLLAGDKVHMGGQPAMNLYTDCVVKAINAAAQKPPK